MQAPLQFVASQSSTMANCCFKVLEEIISFDCGKVTLGCVLIHADGNVTNRTLSRYMLEAFLDPALEYR